MDLDCTIYKTADIIGKRWTLLILLEIFRASEGGKGKGKRYSDIKRNLPKITPKILSLRLKELEEEGMVVKKIDASSFPIKCEYSLTKQGGAFIDIIKDIKKWALKWRINNKVCSKTNCEECTL